jgi:pimeloyl-ACP methyl ester carboxylesterase
MKSIRPIQSAKWMLEHLTDGTIDEALSGDLLEEFHSGRSALWYWRQVSSAIAIGAFGFVRRRATLLAFSAVWAMLYPVWIRLLRHFEVGEISSKWTGLAWPYSSLVEILYGVVPAVVFVWIGCAVYLLLSTTQRRRCSVEAFTHALSRSLTVLLLGTIGLLYHLKHPQVDLDCLTRGDFYATCSFRNFSLLLAASLFASLVGFPLLRRIGSKERSMVVPLCLVLFLTLPATAQTSTSAPTIQFVTVDQDVRLETVDWGGTGRPLVFLGGLGNTAHIFDKFAPKFTGKYHVYGITRRGFGASSKPTPTNTNYTAERLGDDVLAVLDALKLDRPVLVGHSLAGEEPSSIGTRHPERVAGLIYLEAGYGYAVYDRVHGDPIFDFYQLQRLFNDFTAGTVRNPDHFTEDFSDRVSRLDKDLKEAQVQDPAVPLMHAPRGSGDPIVDAIHLGATEYTKIQVPALAIFACPHNFDSDPSLKNDPKLKAALIADNIFYTSRQADAFAAAIPGAHVVRLPNADHYVFRSNEADVIREMNAFLTTLR